MDEYDLLFYAVVYGLGVGGLLSLAANAVSAGVRLLLYRGHE
jgi:hypothetical protein